MKTKIITVLGIVSAMFISVSGTVFACDVYASMEEANSSGMIIPTIQEQNSAEIENLIHENIKNENLMREMAIENEKAGMECKIEKTSNSDVENTEEAEEIEKIELPDYTSSDDVMVYYLDSYSQKLAIQRFKDICKEDIYEMVQIDGTGEVVLNVEPGTYKILKAVAGGEVTEVIDSDTNNDTVTISSDGSAAYALIKVN